jgi:LPXTG-motif cell wall-anchored protein
MANRSRWLLVVLIACFMLSSARFVAAQGSGYSIVAVMPDGGVVIRGPNGTHLYNVPAGTTFSVDGKPTSVADLRPGNQISGDLSGISSWHGTTVLVNEELNARIAAMAGNSMLITGARGTRAYQWKEANDIHILKEGKEIDPLTLKVGDVITGMIVTKAAPSTQGSTRMTMAESAPAPKPAAAPPPRAAAAPAPPPPAPAAAPAPAPAEAPKVKKLPKTASSVPLAALIGAAFVAAGALTTIRRRRLSGRSV